MSKKYAKDSLDAEKDPSVVNMKMYLAGLPVRMASYQLLQVLLSSSLAKRDGTQYLPQDCQISG